MAGIRLHAARGFLGRRRCSRLLDGVRSAIRSRRFAALNDTQDLPSVEQPGSFGSLSSPTRATADLRVLDDVAYGTRATRLARSPHCWQYPHRLGRTDRQSPREIHLL